MSENHSDGETHAEHSERYPQPLSVPVSFDISEATRTADNTWEIHMADGTSALVTRDENRQFDCTCGNCRRVQYVMSAADGRDVDGPTIHMGTPSEQAQRTRCHARCDHVAIVQDSHDGPCPNCGGLSHVVTDYYKGSRPGVVMTSLNCVACGHQLNNE